MNKKNAILLFGGKSFEHDISIITALIIYRNTRHLNYNLLPVYVDRNNEWFFYAGDCLKNEMFKDFRRDYKKNGFVKINFKIGEKGFYYKSFFKEKRVDVDVCLNCCHGGDGEDGKFVDFLNMFSIPCSSHNATALGICMNKVLTKRFASSIKVPVVKYVSLTKEKYFNDCDQILKMIENLKFPVIIKPANLGSSIGIKIVHTIDNLDNLIKETFELDHEILVEKAIIKDMEEYNIACVKIGDEIIVSQIDKPIKSDEILSFKDKYIGEGVNGGEVSLKKNSGELSASKYLNGGQYLNKRIFNINIDESVKQDIVKYAENLYGKLNLSGVVRIDFICEKNKVYLNEINAVPGSLAYYFYVPHVYKTLSGYINSMLDQCVKDYQVEKSIDKVFITNLF